MEEPENNKVNQKSSPNLFSLAVKGGFWVFAIRIFIQLISIGRYIILLNFLTLEDIGLLGVALLLMHTLDCFTNTGFNAALIQKDKKITTYLNTAWTVGIIRACLLFGVLYILAPYMAAWKVPPEKISQTIWVIRVSGISFFISALNNSGVIYFRKELQFHKQFALDVIPTFISVVVTIILVFIYRSVWSLVLGRISANIARCTLSYIMHPFRPKLKLDMEKVRELWSFAKWVFASTVLGFLMTQGDDYFVWGYLGYGALGLYLAAYKFSNIPTTEITNVISQVSFPAYSKLQDDIPRLKDAYLKVLKMSTSLSMPVAGLVFILAPQFVTIFLKPRWLPIITPMQILAIFGLVRALGTTTGPVFQAVNRPSVIAKCIFVKLVFLVLIIFPLTRDHGISGTSLAILLAGLLVQPIAIYYIIKILKCSIRSLITICIAPSIATALMIGAITALKYTINDTAIWAFCLMSVVGVSTYIMALAAIDRLFGLEYYKTIKEQFNAIKAKP